MTAAEAKTAWKSVLDNAKNETTDQIASFDILANGLIDVIDQFIKSKKARALPGQIITNGSATAQSNPLEILFTIVD